MVDKIWRPIKAVLWTVAAILILVFREEVVLLLNYLVGGIMVAYGLETVVLHLVKKESFKKENRFFWGLIEVAIGITLIFLIDLGDPEGIPYATVCVVWAIWSMLREALEIEEGIREILHKEPALLSLAESLVAIVFSVLLLLQPGEHHAMTHVILLFVELITAGVIFPYGRVLIHRLKVKHGTAVEEEE